MINKLKRAIGQLNGEALRNYRVNAKHIEEEYNQCMQCKFVVY